MATDLDNTPSGVNEPALPLAGLLRSNGAPCRILSHGEMLALLDGETAELPPELLLKQAKALHARRALEQALDHGSALLAALGLPRLVDADFVQVDGDALGDALEVVVAHLDTLDPDPDLEPEDDLLEAGGDDELDLGWPALRSQVNLGNNTADGDTTAPEWHGMGFVRCAPDDHEDGADAE